MSENNYNAIVVRLPKPRKHENADKLQCYSIFGNNIITDLNSSEGDLGVYFPLECALSKAFMYENNLYSNSELNKDKTKKGYFGDHGRVKAVKLRGEPSMGIWLPITCLDWSTDNKILYIGNLLKEGYEFQNLNGYEICSKYIPKRNIPSGNKSTRKQKKVKKQSRIIEGQFNFHFDTAQLGKNIHKIHPDDIISISWKLHGTSAIASNCLVKKKLTKLNKFFKFLGADIREEEYDYLYASRKVVKNEELGFSKNHYYKYDLWTEVGKEYFENKLYTGETIYYEIIGFTKDGNYIQKDFDYGCSEKQCKIYVYRITRTAKDGSITELSDDLLRRRCLQLEVNPVPAIYNGKAKSLFPINEETEEWSEKFFESLSKYYVYNQDSIFCKNKVPEEGICIRKEGLEIEVFKLKSFAFLEKESKDLDSGKQDLETSQSIEENDIK